MCIGYVVTNAQRECFRNAKQLDHNFIELMNYDSRV